MAIGALEINVLIVDTHTHLYCEEFDDDRDDVVKRALAAGVSHLLMPNINVASLPRMVEMCANYPSVCSPMIGLHPEDVHDDYQSELETLRQSLEQSVSSSIVRFVGIGEVGLDFYWDSTYRNQQIDALEQQVQWSLHYDLPLVIHSRSAFRELYELMDKYRSFPLKGIFHCFNGTLEEAQALLSFPGFKLGIGGTVTYKKSSLPDVLRSVPLERVVVETDAPYLAPVPHRGHRNESAFIVHTVRRLAEVYGLTSEAVAAATAQNAFEIFPSLAGQ
mgnify:CR=1 FL=1